MLCTVYYKHFRLKLLPFYLNKASLNHLTQKRISGVAVICKPLHSVCMTATKEQITPTQSQDKPLHLCEKQLPIRYRQGQAGLKSKGEILSLAIPYLWVSNWQLIDPWGFYQATSVHFPTLLVKDLSLLLNRAPLLHHGSLSGPTAHIELKLQCREWKKLTHFLQKTGKSLGILGMQNRNIFQVGKLFPSIIQH